MEPALLLLLSTAVSIAFLHTLIGVDHSLPFVVLGRSQGWSLRKTLVITFLCGLGHVMSSILLGLAGIGLGAALTRLEWIEAKRGNIAAWLLIGFGLVYAAWSMAKIRRQTSEELAEGHLVHGHGHTHLPAAKAGEKSEASVASLTAWSLFLIFAFGPCEPLIPLLMFPAAKLGVWATALVALVFALVTIGTMLAVVSAGYLGLRFFRIEALERYAQPLAGGAIALSGLAIQIFGI